MRVFRGLVFLLLVCASPSLAQIRSRQIVFLPATTITTARAGVVSPSLVPVPITARNLTVQAKFAYGSAGTTAKAWVQTSLDGGTTWIDIMAFAFTTASATKVSAVRLDIAMAAAYAPTDGTLADDTIKDGLIGDLLRVKWTSTGTYAGSTTLTLTGTIN